MGRYAPEAPTTEQLENLYPLNEVADLEIAMQRERIGGLLAGEQRGLVAIVGPCAMTAASEIIAQEGEMMAELTRQEANKGLVVTHRMPTWKPRTDPKEWHGLETTEPELAYKTLIRQANQGAGTSIEIGHFPHMERYGKATVFSWFGGRNIDNYQLMEQVALRDPALPLAVKNGLDGNIQPALRHVANLNRARTSMYGQDVAPVVLLYRGGENATDRRSWEHQYRQAFDATDGLMIVDLAHGTEMAHDPKGAFKKSIQGQKNALVHLIALAKKGLLPVGVMMEASNAHSPTDPVIPITVALDGIKSLFKIRTNMPSLPV